jgi:hypothetical protein
MNKLREKLNDSIITNIEIRESENRMHFEYNHLELAEKCEQITDDFSIKFLIWIATDDNVPTIKEGATIEQHATELQQYFKENVYNK